MDMGGMGVGAGSAFVQEPSSFGRSNSMNAMYSMEEDDYSNEPPLLEELDIDFSKIMSKTRAVMQPFRTIDPLLVGDADLTGPVLFCMCLGFTLLLAGKVHFGFIYGFFVFGCWSIYMLLNLMTKGEHIGIWMVMSTLGYCLLPIVIVSVLGIVFSLTGIIGNFIGAGAVGWSTLTATRLFGMSLNMESARFLIAYPVGLLYACFVLMTIF